MDRNIEEGTQIFTIVRQRPRTWQYSRPVEILIHLNWLTMGGAVSSNNERSRRILTYLDRLV